MKIMIKNALGGYDNLGDISSIDRICFPFQNGNAHKWMITARFQNNSVTILFVGKHNGEEEEIDQWFQWFKNAYSIASQKNKTAFLDYPYESSRFDRKEAQTLIEMFFGSKNLVSSTGYNGQPYGRRPISDSMKPDYGMN